MMDTLLSDPLRLWRESVNRLEGIINNGAARNMQSPEFSRALNQLSKVSVGLQHVFEKALSRYFRQMNMPTRVELEAVAEAVRRLEDKLDQLLPAPAPTGPRPARTRHPAPLPETLAQTIKPSAPGTDASSTATSEASAQALVLRPRAAIDQANRRTAGAAPKKAAKRASPPRRARAQRKVT